MIFEFAFGQKRYFPFFRLLCLLIAVSISLGTLTFAQTTNGLKAEYYSNTQLGLVAAKTKTDATIDFDWAYNAPLPEIGTDRFSVRWIGKVTAPVTGTYTFATYSDDGVRLWVNKRLLINNWTLHGTTRNAGTEITLTAGQKYDIRLEYYENYGAAVAKLLWSYPGQTEQIVPTTALTPAAPLSTPISANKAARFLMQATFGPTPADITRVQDIGYSAWLDEQFYAPYSSYHDPLAARKAAGENFYREAMGREVGRHTIVGVDQLRQRVADALSQILVVSFNDGDLDGEATGIAGYMDVLQRNSFGRYRQLLEDTTLNQAMGLYLDMLRNDKGDPVNGLNPNENYAREVLQLFSIGTIKLNADGTPQRDAGNQTIPTYGQAEVKGFAKVFTGWSYGGDYGTWYYPTDGKFQWNKPMNYYPERHSIDAKVLLNGTTLPAGQTGQQDLTAALDNIANHPNVAPFISRQLIQRLVTSNPSPAYVGRVAAKFNNNGSNVRGDLRAVIKAILLDTEARNPPAGSTAGYGKLREPMIRYLHLLRACNASSTTGIYPIEYIESTAYGVGQMHFHAPSVFNFYSPDYAPQGAVSEAGLKAPEFQITTDTQIINATNTMIYLLYGGIQNDVGNVTMDYSLLMSKAGNPTELVNTMETLFVPGGLSQTTRTELVAYVTENTDPNNPTDRVRNTLMLLIMTPDFSVER